VGLFKYDYQYEESGHLQGTKFTFRSSKNQVLQRGYDYAQNNGYEKTAVVDNIGHGLIYVAFLHSTVCDAT
jgi:hypothetical protein